VVGVCVVCFFFVAWFVVWGSVFWWVWGCGVVFSVCVFGGFWFYVCF